MFMAGSHPSFRRAAPPIPFSVLLGFLFVFLASAVWLRWPRGEDVAGTVTREGGGPGVAGRGPGVVAPPRCTYADAPTARHAYSEWESTLLDTTYSLPRTYSPPDLVTADRAGFSGAFLVRALLVEDLTDLRSAAEAAGHPVELAAAFRSYVQQADLFERREASLGLSNARRGTARPGHSEHQLGTAVDFKSRGAADVTMAWGATPAGRWMQANAHRFGFVLSYPNGRTGVTCYGYEPWHFRYFGRALAAKIRSSGLTAREYLWAIQKGRATN